MFILFSLNNLLAESRPASPDQVAMITISISAHSRNIQELKYIDIYVIGNTDIANALKKYEDQRIGKARIRSVKFGDQLPAEKPAIIVCGDDAYASMVKNYTRKNSVLSIGASPKSAESGLSLSIAQDFYNEDEESLSKVVIFLNLTASFHEQIYWDKNIATVTQQLVPCDFKLVAE